MPQNSAPGCDGASPGLRGLKDRVVELALRGLPRAEGYASHDAPHADSARDDARVQTPRSLRSRIAKSWVSLRLRRKARQIKGYMEDSVKQDVVREEPGAKERGGTETLQMHCEAVAELSEPCRQVYLLRKAKGLSHREIGASLGITVSAVEAHLLNAVEHCDRYLREWTDSQSRRSPHLDQKNGSVSAFGRESGKLSEVRCTDVDRTRGAEVAHSDGRRRAADGG